MSDYGSIHSLMFEYVSVYLNIPQYAWRWLNIAECLLMSLKMPEWTVPDNARVLSIPGYSYNNIIIIIIIIITNVMLEFLSARFIHPVALLPFYLFLTQVRT